MTPLILGVGGTPKPNSSTELALKVALDAAATAGARTRIFDGAALAQLPLYLTQGYQTVPMAAEFVAAVREADGIILASPGYHGTISGLVKNAIDYVEETARDERVYLAGLPVGLIATAFGWQATGSTLVTLRSIVHALRGWPTPFGAAINTSSAIFHEGRCCDETVASQLNLIGKQVVDFIRHPSNEQI